MSDPLGTPPNRPLLSARGLRLAFGGVKAADGIDLDVMPGEFLAIIGPNGAGKTTLLRTVMGLVAPGRGEIRLAGASITRRATCSARCFSPKTEPERP